MFIRVHFFSKVTKDVLSFDEDFSVNIVQSADIFEEIYNAISVEKLFIAISYTNADDISEDATEWMDNQLRVSQTSKASLQFESDQNKNINIDTTLIKGALGLAAENGEVEATVKDINNRRVRIITKNHPKEVRTISPNETAVKNVIFEEVMDKYRNGRRDNKTD